MQPMNMTARCKRIPPPRCKSRISSTLQPRIEQKNTLNVRFAVAESIFLRTMMMAFQSQWATGSTFVNHRKCLVCSSEKFASSKCLPKVDVAHSLPTI